MKLIDSAEALGQPMRERSSADAIPERSWYALAILTLIYACHILDRMMISIVVEPIRAEFALSDSQVGLLTGLSYGVMYAAAGIPLGMLIDRVNRIRLLASLVAAWSGITALSALTRNFVQILIVRMGVGAAESGGSPASLSLISDLFPASKRSTAVGCLFLSNAIGALLCVLIGGFVATHYGWRHAMVMASVPGIVLAAVVYLTVAEPARGEADRTLNGRKAAGVLDTLQFIWNARGALHLLTGVTLTAAGVSAIGAWLPAFVMRSLSLDLSQAGLSLGLANGICGALGSLIGGVLGDRLGASDPRRRIDLSMGACILAAIFAIMGLRSNGSVLSVGLIGVSMMMAFAVFSTAFSSVLSVAPSNMRGLVAAVMEIGTNLIGFGLGPLAVGMLSDCYGGDLRAAMITVVGVCFIWAAFHFWRAARSIGA